MQIKDVIIFSAGLLIGGGSSYFATKQFVHKKLAAKLEEEYEARYQKELQSVKESFAELAEKDKQKAEINKDKPSLEVYTEALNRVREREKQAEEQKKENERVNYSTIATSSSDSEDPDTIPDETTPLIDTSLIDETTDTSQPYILKRWPTKSEQEYTQLEVTYYADGTYADSMDTEMEIEDYIGRAMMDYVENTEKDEVYIRNDELCLDIDIRKDLRTYDEVMFN